MPVLWALERVQGRNALYPVVFQRPSLQLTEDQSEPARGWGHLSRSSPAPPLQLGPLLPVPPAPGPSPCPAVPTSLAPLLTFPFLTSPLPNLPFSLFAFIYFGLASCPSPHPPRFPLGSAPSFSAAPFRTPRKALCLCIASVRAEGACHRPQPRPLFFILAFPFFALYFFLFCFVFKETVFKLFLGL